MRIRATRSYATPPFLFHRAYFIENKMENGQPPRANLYRVVNPRKLPHRASFYIYDSGHDATI